MARSRAAGAAGGARPGRTYVVREQSDDPYKRFFWLMVAAVIALAGTGIVSYFTTQRNAAVEQAALRTDVAQIKVQQEKLSDVGQKLGEMSSKTEMVYASLTELRSQLSAIGADRYTGSQAATDRLGFGKLLSDMTQPMLARLDRAEESLRDLAEFKARIEQWVRGVEDGPRRVTTDGKE